MSWSYRTSNLLSLHRRSSAEQYVMAMPPLGHREMRKSRAADFAMPMPSSRYMMMMSAMRAPLACQVLYSGLSGKIVFLLQRYFKIGGTLVTSSLSLPPGRGISSAMLDRRLKRIPPQTAKIIPGASILSLATCHNSQSGNGLIYRTFE